MDRKESSNPMAEMRRRRGDARRETIRDRYSRGESRAVAVGSEKDKKLKYPNLPENLQTHETLYNFLEKYLSYEQKNHIKNSTDEKKMEYMIKVYDNAKRTVPGFGKENSKSKTSVSNTAKNKLINKVSVIPKLLWGWDDRPTYVESKKEVLEKVALEYTETEQEYREKSEGLQLNIQNTRQRYRQELEEKKAKVALMRKDFEKEISKKELELKRDRENDLKNEVTRLEEEKKTLEQEYKDNIVSEVKSLQALNKDIDKILSQLGFDMRNVTVKDLDIPIEDIQYNDIAALYADSKDELFEILENPMGLNKVWESLDKSKKRTGTIGAVTLTAMAAATPLVMLTSAVMAGKIINDLMTNKQKIESILSNMLTLKKLSMKLITYELSKPMINLSYMDDERKVKAKEIEEKYNTLFNEFERYKKESENKLEEAENRDYTDEYNTKMSEDIKTLDSTVEAIKKQFTEKLAALKTKTIEESALFEKYNKIEEIINDKMTEYFAAVKESKNKVIDFITLNDFKGMTYGVNKETSENKLEVLRAKYDKEIQEVVIPKLEKGLTKYSDKKGYEEDLEKALRKEDELYLLDLSKIHLGELITPTTNMHNRVENYFATLMDNGSVLFIYENESEKRVLTNLVKYITQQIQGALHPSATEVSIINPDLLTDFNSLTANTTIFTKEGKRVRNVNYSTNLSGDDITTYEAYLTRTWQKRNSDDFVGGKTIKDVIFEKRNSGSLTPKYIINIIPKGDQSSSLDIYNNNSEDTGVINFRFIRKSNLVEFDKTNEGVSENNGSKIMIDGYSIDPATQERFERCLNIVEVDEILGDGTSTISIYHKNSKKYAKFTYKNKTEKEFGGIAAYLEDRFKKSLGMIPPKTVDEFISKLTGGVYYQYNSLKGIALHFGYEDGDMSKLTKTFLDETSNPHMYIGGITGGGKSVLLSCAINALKATYSPRELEVWYYDFKVVEAMMHAYPYQWANCSCISGSATVDYVVSVMYKLVEIMEKRYLDFKDLGVNNYSSYRSKLEKLAQAAKDAGDMAQFKKYDDMIPPRLAVFIDELMAGVNSSDEAKDAINIAMDKLMSLARAAGIHVIALSQAAPVGLKESIITNFATRGCTKASKDVSVGVLRNDFASRPENQILGFMGVNADISGAEEANQKFIVPFSEEVHSKRYSKLSDELADKYCKDRKKVAVIFSDDDKKVLSDMELFLKDSKLEKPKREIFLGDEVRYMDKYYPAKIELKRESNSHIGIVTSSSEVDKEILNLLFYNFNKANQRCLFMFPKEPPEWIDWDKACKTPFRTDSGAMVDPNGFSDDMYNIVSDLEYKRRELEEDLDEWTITEKDYYDKIENGYFQESVVKVYYHSGEEYGKRTYRDYSMTYIGKFMNDLTMLLDAKKNKIKSEGLTKAERDSMAIHFFVLFHPELDVDMINERVFQSDKDLANLLAEASEYNTYVITITNKADWVQKPWNRYIIGKLVGSENESEKIFKKLESGLARVADTLDNSKNYKAKLATDDKQRFSKF